MNTFEIKTVIQFGSNSLEYLKTLKDQKVFIVTDPFMIESGMIEKVTDELVDKDYQIFSDVVPDPPIELIIKGVESVIKYQPDAMVALGGGSAIDAAKAIMDFSKKIGKLGKMKLIAIPTTSGTGSEVTSFSVITDKQKGVKYPLVSESLLPDVAILNTDLVKSVPPSVVADTGMDVLTHALEAYVSTNATDFSDALAEKAVQLVFLYLKRSYQNKEDTEAREKMHIASCIAGIAFNIASLGINHAIAHNIGGKLHIPHGRANTILLPYVISYNANIQGYSSSNSSYSRAAQKYAYIAKLAGIQGSNTRMYVKNLIHEIGKLQKDMKMPLNLRECKLAADEIQKVKNEIAEGALEDACINTNPRKPTKNEINEILQSII